MSQDNLALCPVAAIAVAAIPSVGGVVIRLDFLTHAMQDSTHPTPGRNYLLYPAAAKQLAQQILAECAALESAAPPTGLGPQH